MLSRILYVFVILTITVSSERATRSPRLVGTNEYFTEAIQELVYELENYGWWNLKMLDVRQTLNEHMYNWHVSGTVNYTNGFVASIEKIDLSGISNSILRRTVNGTEEWNGAVWGNVILRNVMVGFDVVVNLNGQPEQRYTGAFTHTSITIQCSISKNMHTKVYTVGAYTSNLAAGSGVRMIYLPNTHVTQVLSRRYVPSNNWDSVTAWCNQIIVPILEKVATKINFPSVCFSC